MQIKRLSNSTARTNSHKEELLKYKEDIIKEISSEKYYYENLIERNSFWTNDYPVCAIRIDLIKKDTFHLVTQSQAKKMPRWSLFKRMEDQYHNHDLFCSPALSAWLGNRVLSFDGWSNKKRLLGTGFLLPSVAHTTFDPEVYAVKKKAYIIPPTESFERRQRLLSKDTTVYYQAADLRKWEQAWKVQFIGNAPSFMQVEDYLNGLNMKIYTDAGYPKEYQLKKLSDTLHNIIQYASEIAIFQKYREYIQEIIIDTGMPYHKRDNFKEYFKTPYFEQKSILFSKHIYMYAQKGIRKNYEYEYEPKKRKYPSAFFTIQEKTGFNSEWAMYEDGKLILWKFDVGSIFEEIDKDKKAFKKFQSDTEYMLFRVID